MPFYIMFNHDLEKFVVLKEIEKSKKKIKMNKLLI